MGQGGTKPWEQKMHEAGARIEEDLTRLITYLNDEVVPDVRRHGSETLRAASVELDRLAARMDDRGNARSDAGVPPVPPADTKRQ